MSNERQADSETISLRGHHLLCILGFRGLGYDEAFVENMQCVVTRIRANPHAALRLVESADAICAACPHDSPDGCTHTEAAGARLSTRDRRVLDVLGLNPDDDVTVASVYALVRERVTEDVLVEDLCKGCDWLEAGYCSEGLLRLNAFSGEGIP